MIWIVRGTQRSTHTPRELRIEAESERDARFKATAAGLVVTSIEPYDGAAPPRDVAGAESGKHASLAAEATPLPQRPPRRTAAVPPANPYATAAPRRGRRSNVLLRHPLMTLLVLLGIGGIAALVVMSRRAGEGEARKHEVAPEDGVAARETGGADPGAAGATKLTSAPIKPTAARFQELQKVVQAIVKELGEKSATQQQELAKGTSSGFLAAERVSTVAKRQETFDTLWDLRLLVNKYEKEQYAILDSFPDRVSKLNLPDPVKSGASAQFKHAAANARDDLRSLANGERDFLDQATRLVEFLEARKGRWKLSENQFIFRSDADTDEYKRRAERVVQSAAEKEKLAQHAKASVAELGKTTFE